MALEDISESHIPGLLHCGYKFALLDMFIADEIDLLDLDFGLSVDLKSDPDSIFDHCISLLDHIDTGIYKSLFLIVCLYYTHRRFYHVFREFGISSKVQTLLKFAPFGVLNTAEVPSGNSRTLLKSEDQIYGIPFGRQRIYFK